MNSSDYGDFKERITPAFYTNRPLTSTIFVKKSIKSHSVASQFQRRKFMSLFFKFQLYTQKYNTVGFTNIQWDSLITTRNYLHFLKNICHQTLKICRWNFLLYFSLHMRIIWLHLKILGYTWKNYEQLILSYSLWANICTYAKALLFCFYLSTETASSNRSLVDSVLAY